MASFGLKEPLGLELQLISYKHMQAKESKDVMDKIGRFFSHTLANMFATNTKKDNAVLLEQLRDLET